MLFEELRIGDLTLRNRIAVSPMCQYSASDGLPNDWHLVHLGARAAGGAGLVIAEAAAVEERGRITPHDVGLWNDAQAEGFRRITDFIKSQGAAPAVQLAHAGRKASVTRPWDGDSPLPPGRGGWRPVGPSPVPFAPGFQEPLELSAAELPGIAAAFAGAARRALAAGFQAVEIHAAHGYLLHQFLSPVSNRRRDAYGGSLPNRMRLTLETARAVRAVWPERLPLLVRVSATDWLGAGSWDEEQTVELARALKAEGVDLVDCSSGGTSRDAAIPAGPGFQVPFAEKIRRQAGVMTGAVGMITSPEQAETVLRTGQADLVLLGRELLRDPYWPLRAAPRLHAAPAPPPQYLRAFGRAA